jgi:hypothetical protein
MLDRPVDVTQPPQGAPKSVERVGRRLLLHRPRERLASCLPVAGGQRFLAAGDEVLHESGVGHRRIMASPPWRREGV